MSAPQTLVNPELLLDFFLKFSRFEYALKASNFFQRRNDPSRPLEAKPDWGSFAVSLRDAFQPDKKDELRQACEYILDSPPWRQVVINDLVAWKSPVRLEHESDLEFLLRMVRCVRNNLFHGGKYNIEVHEETERTERLLKNSLIILNECLTLAPIVKQVFDQATI